MLIRVMFSANHYSSPANKAAIEGWIRPGKPEIIFSDNEETEFSSFTYRHEDEMKDYSVRWFQNPVEAFEYIKEHPQNIAGVIADWFNGVNPKGLNGGHLVVEALKRNIPSLIMTNDPTRATFFTNNPLVRILKKTDWLQFSEGPKSWFAALLDALQHRETTGWPELPKQQYNQLKRDFALDQARRKGKG